VGIDVELAQRAEAEGFQPSPKAPFASVPVVGVRSGRGLMRHGYADLAVLS
jgi:hypothetical protein